MRIDAPKPIGGRVLLPLFAIALFASLAGPPPGVADDGVLRVGTSGDYAPFSSFESEIGASVGDGFQRRGFDIEVAERFASDRGLRIEWVPFRWSELIDALSANRFDLAMSGVTVRPERSLVGRFSVPVVASGAVLLVRRSLLADHEGTHGLDSSSQTIDRLGLRIAVNAGGHLERVARARFTRSTVIPIPDNAAVREALVSGEFDAALSDSLEAPGWLEGTRDLVALPPMTRDRKAYLIRKDRAELAADLDDWLLEAEREGVLAELRERALGGASSERVTEPLAALLAAVDERLSLMPWIAAEKHGRGMKIEDRAQEERVVEAMLRAVGTAAGAAGLPAPDGAAVEAFQRAQIEVAKSIQRATIETDRVAQMPASDLDSVLRPALGRIGPRLASLLVRVSQLERPGNLRQRVERELRAVTLTGDDLDALSRAIDSLMRPLPSAPTVENQN